MKIFIAFLFCLLINNAMAFDNVPAYMIAHAFIEAENPVFVDALTYPEESNVSAMELFYLKSHNKFKHQKVSETEYLILKTSKVVGKLQIECDSKYMCKAKTLTFIDEFIFDRQNN